MRRGRLRRRRGARGRKGRSIADEATEAFHLLFCRVERIKTCPRFYAEAEPEMARKKVSDDDPRVARLETRCAHAVGPTAPARRAARNICPYPKEIWSGVDRQRFSIWQCWKPERSLLSRSASSRARGRAAACRNRRERNSESWIAPARQLPKMAGASASAQTRRSGFIWDSGAQQGQLFFLGPSLSPLYRPLEKRVVRHVERRSPTCY